MVKNSEFPVGIFNWNTSSSHSPDSETLRTRQQPWQNPKWLLSTSRVHESVVSASDVTPTERWLNIWCIWYTYLETLLECRSRRRIGWIIQDFRETCVSHSLTFRLETKMLWCQTPSRKKKAVVFTTVTTNAYQDQVNAGFSKVCEIFKVHGIESLKYIREFHTPVCYCGDISTPRNVMLNKTNCDWLFDMSVKRPHGRALANESYHTFQTWRSGYARLMKV